MKYPAERRELHRHTTFIGLLLAIICGSISLAYGAFELNGNKAEYVADVRDFSTIAAKHLKQFEYSAVISMAEILLKRRDIQKLYVEDNYGMAVFGRKQDFGERDYYQVFTVHTNGEFNSENAATKVGAIWVSLDRRGVYVVWIISIVVAVSAFYLSYFSATRLIGVYIDRFVTEPIANLNSAISETLLTGRPAPSAFSGDTHLGRLSESFNDMQAQLLQTRQELETLVHEKEQMAAELRDSLYDQLEQKERHATQLRAIGGALLSSDQYVSYFGDRNQLVYSNAYSLKNGKLKNMMLSNLGSTEEFVNFASDNDMEAVTLDLPSHEDEPEGFSIELFIGEQETWLLQYMELKDGEKCRLLHNITNMRIMQNRMRHLDKMDAIGAMAGGVAHDINNLLAVIRGNVEIARNLCAAEITPKLTSALMACDSSAAVVRSLLSFARESSLEKSEVAVASLISSMKPMFQSMLQPNVSLHTSIDTLRTIMIDADQFGSVLANLIINARDAMPDGGSVKISARDATVDERRSIHLGVKEAAVVVEVKDNGPGIPENIRARVFEPFVSTKGGHDHTGLGLASAYGFTRQSGGDLRLVESGEQGATFRFVFPAVNTVRRPVPTLVSDSDRGQKQQHHRKSILLVDDNEPLLDVLDEAITSWGYRTVTATSVASAIEILDGSQKHALIVTDLNLPDGSGFQIVRAACERNHSTPSILLTGNRCHGHHDGESFAEFSHVMQKPVCLKKLRAVVAELIPQGALQLVSS